MNAVTVSSPDEADRLRTLYGRHAEAVIPSSVDPAANAQRAVGARTVGWLGTLDYPPNRAGLIHFVREAWAPLGEAGYELLIAGGGDSPDVRDLTSYPDVRDLTSYPGVRVLGFVQSLEEFLGRLGTAVVPLWEGAGIKLKTVSFLAAGVPVVSPTVGVEGLGSRPGHDVIVADQPRELATHLQAVLADERVATALGDAGRNLIVRDFNWNAIGPRFVSVVEQAVDRSRRENG